MPKKITSEIEQTMRGLKDQCLKAESKGNFNTAHHEMLANYEKEYGALKELRTEESTKEKQNAQ